MLRKILTAAVAALGVGLALVGVKPAAASTLRCTSTESCGGATSAYTAKGALSLSVLKPDSTVNGGFGYWNEPVGVNSSGLADGSQDFTVYQESGERPGLGGVYGHGDYVVVYTPGGKVPDDPAFGGGGTQTAYCLSVQDVYRTVRGQLAQRWAAVLRGCDAAGRWGIPKFVSGTTSPEVPAVVGAPDPYQLWAPVEVSGPALEFQDVALNTASYRHGFGGSNFVLDDTAFGGAGTQGLAYPENDGLNQKWSIDGCTKPVTVFNTAYYNCAAGPAPAPTVTVTP